MVCVYKADRNACLGEINFANMMKLSRGRTYICNWHVHRLSGHENAHKIYFKTKIMLFKAPPNQHSRRYITIAIGRLPQCTKATDLYHPYFFSTSPKNHYLPMARTPVIESRMHKNDKIG